MVSAKRKRARRSKKGERSVDQSDRNIDDSSAILVDPALLGDGVGAVLPARKKVKKKEEKRKSSISKREQKRRQKQLEISNRKRERIQLLEAAAKVNLSSEQLRFLNPSSEIGLQKQTRRQKLSKDLERHRANLPLESGESRLFVDVENHEEEAEEESGGTEDDGVPSEHADGTSGGSSEEGVGSEVEEESGAENQGDQISPVADVVPSEAAETEKRGNRDDAEGRDTSGAAKSGPGAPVLPVVRTTRKRQRRTGRLTVTEARKLLSEANGSSTSANADEPVPTTIEEVMQLLRREMGQGEKSEGSEEQDAGSDGSEEGDGSSGAEESDEGDSDDSSVDESDKEVESEGEQDEEADNSDQETSKEGKTNDETGLSSEKEAKISRTAKPQLHTKLVVRPDRPPELAEQRLKLPVCEKELEIMEAIFEEDVVAVTGATGTGKTTQVPQFLFEAGFGDARSDEHSGSIVVTQPRRVAVMSCAARVAEELGVKLGESVGYQIRHHAKVSADTKIAFVTDGILLREVEEDLLLRSRSAVIIDEAHERSINTDLLLTLLSRAVILRRQSSLNLGPLKLIVMSATLDVEGIFRGASPLFKEHRLIDIEAKQFPVTIHFSRRTEDNYAEEAFKKVCKIHRRLPAGGILVFMTGKKEVESLCARLAEELDDLTVLPLYAMLPEKQQRKVFETTGNRKIVVATNVAETSITIPDIVYVVDSGRAKQREYERGGLVSSFEIQWISKSSAKQRAGRAGRTQAGHCYRLYSAAVFQHEFSESITPEVVRVPVDSLVLRLLSMGITNIDKFPLPSKPLPSALDEALGLLRTLGLVTDKGEITELGQRVSQLPTSPRYGKLMAVAGERGCARYGARIAASLSTGEVFTDTTQVSDPNSPFYDTKSEIFVRLRVVCAAELASSEAVGKSLNAFCVQHRLNKRNLKEIIDTAHQLEKLYQELFGAIEDGESIKKAGPSSKAEQNVLLQAILAAFPDHVAKRIAKADALMMGIKVPRFLAPFQTPLIDDKLVFLPTSSLGEDDVDYVTFVELVQFVPDAAKDEDDDLKQIMKMSGATITKRRWISRWASTLCSFGPALPSPDPYYEAQQDEVMCYVRATYGKAALPLGTVPIVLSKGIRLDHIRETPHSVFARELLRGRVIPSIKASKSAANERLVEKIRLQLETYGVRSKSTLLDVWKQRNSNFLKEIILPLTLQSTGSIHTARWPPIPPV